MRIVAPYRPFPPESDWHRETAASFDWIGAIGMMRHSAALACGCSVDMLTDVDTVLPFPMLRYQTYHRRLMLWSLEVSACFLASDDFDQNTVALDSDQLIFRSLTPWFQPEADLTVLIRPRIDRSEGLNNMPILNGVQWWAYASRDRLVAFYRRALEVAIGLPEERIAWGADTDALVQLLDPRDVGIHECWSSGCSSSTRSTRATCGSTCRRWRRSTWTLPTRRS